MPVTINGSGAFSGSRIASANAVLGNATTLAYGATITPDLSVTNNFAVTLTGNTQLANPSNVQVGQSGVIVITQDATGSRTMTFGSAWKFPNGIVPALSYAGGAVDVLSYYVASATQIVARLANDVK